MRDVPHALLIDLLAAHDGAAAFGCGLDPRLLELLIDRHAEAGGTHRLDRLIRVDGPPQVAPQGWAGIGSAGRAMPGASHARR
ncbi:MAG: hypothetical protein ACK4KW_11225 [Gemmobacter sp.]